MSSDGNDNDSDLDDISPHVRIRVKPETKRKWLEYTDENDLTLTDLITTSVNNTISDDWVLADEQDSTGSAEVDTSGLEAGVETLKDRLSAIETQLDDLSVSDASNEDLDRMELVTLANNVHDKLPVVADETQLIEISQHVTGLDHQDRPRVTGTAQDISAVLDEPEHQIRSALIYLEQQENTSIASTIHDGTRRWFERDPMLEDTQEVVENLELDLPPEATLEFDSASEFDDYERSEDDVVIESGDDDE
ncbi:hypothetical protein HTG_16835 [Natrinema mahii]|nr:hypothetical protein HTG_16835 [Natrinema mahii]